MIKTQEMNKLIKKRNAMLKSFNAKVIKEKRIYLNQSEIAWDKRSQSLARAEDEYEKIDAKLETEYNQKIKTLETEKLNAVQSIEQEYFASKEGKKIYNLLDKETRNQLKLRPLQKSVFESIIMDYGKSLPKDRYQKLANLVLKTDDGYSFEHTKRTVCSLLICDSWLDGSLSEEASK